MPRKLLSICLLCLPAGAPAWAQPSAAEPLDDSSFWRLVSTLSEPEGSFADENFVSNELGLQRLLPELQRRIEPGGVYLGVGPEQNFSYVAILEPAIAFIVDIRRQNMLEHLLYKALFERADSRSEFLALLFSRREPAGLGLEATAVELLRAYRVAPADPALAAQTLADALASLTRDHGFGLSADDEAVIAKVLDAFLEAGPAISYTYRESDDWHPNFVQLMDMSDASGTNWSFLGSEQRFARVRQLQLENRIVPVVGDFAGAKSLRAIGDYLRERGRTVDVFYVSNVEPYLFEADIAGAFYENLAALPISGDSLIVRTFFGSSARACPGSDPVLRAPLLDSIPALLTELRAGQIDSVCALIERSR